MDLRKLFAPLSFCLSFYVGFAQPAVSGYDAKWKLIDSLYSIKGLPESALAEVNKLYAKAKLEHNEPQAIRALMYRSVLNTKNEGTEIKLIRELDSAIATTHEPERSILNSLLAGTYQRYIQNNRWKLYNRSKTVNFVKKDIATWSAEDFYHTIDSLYRASLQEEQLLWSTKLDAYDPILIKGNVRFLRPTLFDVLAHEALRYYIEQDSHSASAADVFAIDDPVALGEASVFAHHRFRTVDSTASHYKALLLYQRLIQHHLKDARPDALIDVDIDRIGFGFENGVMDNKDTVYAEALARITQKYGDSPTAAEAWYLQAQRLRFPDETKDPLDSARYDNKKAKAICERVVAQKDSSEGKEHCKNLLAELTEKTLSMKTEKVNIPGTPMRSLISWSNFDHLYMRLISLNGYKTELPVVVHGNDAYWKELFSQPLVRQFDMALPATGDYRHHSVEIAIGSLPSGVYALVGSPDNKFTYGSSIMAVQYFYVSNIAFVEKRNDYFVVNRESGKPLAGAKVQVWDMKYSSSDGRSHLQKSDDVYETDKQGHFRLRELRPKETFGMQMLEVTTADDHLFLRDMPTPWNRYEEAPEADSAAAFEARHRQVYFFLDRAIYRPGQSVYFKGIAVTKDWKTRHTKVVSSWPTMVMLYNANGIPVDTLKVKTNEFGSYHGVFRLPVGQLNGSFRIAGTPGGGVKFSVEEYKRPVFYVDYKKQTGSYRVGDSIHVTGNAKAYAGNAVDGATVKYRVVRKNRFHPWLYWRSPRPADNGQDVQHGTVKTDAKGAFYITFAAVPDRSIPRSQDPRFEYEVAADVTDINGETRSGVTTIVAGYTSLDVSIDVKGGSHQAADSLRELRVRSKNLSGEPVAAPMRLTVFPLQAPGRLIRARLWEAPDRYLLPEKQFLDSFPHDEYREELKKESWERGAAAWEATTSDSESVFRVPAGRLSPGWYLVEAKATDAHGQEVKDIQYVELFDGKTDRPANPQYSWDFVTEQTIEPGGKATVTVGSSASDVYVIRKIEHVQDWDVHNQRDGWSQTMRKEDTAARFNVITLSKEKKSFELNVAESDRGGIGIADVFVKDNRFYARQTVVHVPWTNKQLTINYKSYRDKTEPGSGEKWSVTIAGQNRDKVSAEVMAAMYDASLDQFVSHTWYMPSLYPEYSSLTSWTGFSFRVENSELEAPTEVGGEEYVKIYDQLFNLMGSRAIMYNLARPMMQAEAEGSEPGVMRFALAKKAIVAHDANPDVRIMGQNSIGTGNGVKTNPPPVQVRKNLNETAFFFPELRTDSTGSVSFSFTMPEALTRWKWMTLAHTQDLAFGYSEKTVVTQKKLMVQPNVPRFLREGDHMDLPVKVVNMSDSELTGQIELSLIDPTTGETADGWFTNRQPNQYFTVAAGQSAVVSFPLVVPFQYNRPLTYRVVARARDFSDGEEATLPIVSNRMLVTETLPLNLRGNGTKQFTFEKLLQSGSSETLNHHSLTVEFTTNPTWYAVQSLPYLMEYPYDCVEQTFNKFYANALATKIVSGSPRLQEVFSRWRVLDTAALLSNLQKNQELKTVLLEETPWVLQGKTEEQQKKKIALLFDLSRMSRELEAMLDRLIALQSSSGGFSWFKGGYDDAYMTQYILTGIGHLQKLDAVPKALSAKVNGLVKKALPFADDYAKRRYAEILESEKKGGAVRSGAASTKIGRPWMGNLIVEYLYMRSFFNAYGLPGDVFPAMNYFRKLARDTWVGKPKYMQGMLALALFRTGDVQTGRDIIKSLRQTAIVDEERGMYWKGMEGGYYWYEAPIETQSLLIETFREIAADAAVDRDLKTWLLKNKQTHSWKTTKATADACYALLLGGADWLNAERSVEIKLGEKVVDFGGAAGSAASPGEAGTGYNKKVFDGPFVSPAMGNINVTMNGGNGSPAWGAVYWQYFDMLDRITPTGGDKIALKVEKKLFIERITATGKVLEPVSDNGVLKPGDRVIVRIELRADRDMEYVHMKDMRGACMEPVNVISQYKWQGGLGYYESTKDVSTDFFFAILPKGTYVFEYPLTIGQAGNFSNGITSIECMYAPEFASHTEGIRVNVEAAQ